MIGIQYILTQPYQNNGNYFYIYLIKYFFNLVLMVSKLGVIMKKFTSFLTSNTLVIRHNDNKYDDFV